MEEYFTVFDVTKAGFKSWPFSTLGLIFIAVGLLLPTLTSKSDYSKPATLLRKWFRRLFLGFAIFWTLASFIGTFADYWRAVDAMRNKRADIIEGLVTQFKPMPYSGHSMESFSVHGVRFEYSDNVITAGFNNTASHGGPIHDGLPVKIWYTGGEILRLDIKDKPDI